MCEDYLNRNFLNILAIVWVPPTGLGGGYGGFSRFLKILEMTRRFNVRFYILSYGGRVLIDDNWNHWINMWSLSHNLSSSYLMRVMHSIISLPLIVIKGLKLRHMLNCIYTPNAEITSACTIAYLLSVLTRKPLILSFQLTPGGALGLVGETYKLFRSQGFGKFSSLFAEFHALVSRFVSLYAAKHARAIIVPSKSLSKYLFRIGVRNPSTNVIPNPIFSAPNKKTRISHKSIPLAVFIGRQTPQKGILDLIKAWKIVASNLPNAKLIIIGYCTREVEKILLREIKFAGIGKSIIKTNFIRRDLLERIMELAKVVILPSRLESQCLSIGEALSHRCYVVCYDIPVIEEFYKKFCNAGAIKRVRVGDINSLAAEIINILKTSSESRSFITYHKDLSQWDEVVCQEIRVIAESSYKRSRKYNEKGKRLLV